MSYASSTSPLPRTARYHPWEACILFLVFFLPFTVPFVGDQSVGGASLRYLREVGLIYCGLIVFAAIFFYRKLAVNLYPQTRLAVVAWFAFAIFYIFTIFGSIDPATAVRYAPKYFIAPVTFLVLAQFRTPSAERMYAALRAGVLVYLAGSIVLHLASNDTFLEGFSGRHYSKFVALLGLMMAFSEMLTGRTYWRSGLLAVLAAVATLLILQRGVLVASFAGAGMIILTVRHSTSEYAKSIMLAFSFVLALVMMFLSQNFLSYAFYSHIDPAYVFEELMNGNWDPRFLRDRGRLEWIRVIFAMAELTWFGIGMGTVPSILGSYLGQSNYELHNDWLLVLFETGFIGFTIWVVLVLLLLATGLRGAKRNSGEIAIYYRSGLGMFFACFVWMAFSNVWSYASVSLTSAILLYLIGAKAEAERDRRERDAV